MLLLIVALVLIGAGISRQGIGLTILYLFVVIPALIAMSISLARKEAEPGTQTVPLGEQVLLLFAGFLKTVGLLFLLMFGIVIALGVFCFVLLASHTIR
jgi:hypothetical protein